ncbi:TadE/TadG family type IV pilus assembly protein [Mesorhizobium sp. M1B.F.Ca.ET.045.04.1.1]|uniref:TadE/TadG family type IV pilus assembly protein n=1 Tax=Mesorhizobium sp. M1B.F.Ca.ET.045.04.1.1 TaxID=2493673 RepID=UPI000F750AC0|nr:TadE/TadG family type IV pilus assembly protein [Mesorhizobium sp. M1B.F.Ca.ET.045.04.1.1]AZO29451.1 pilus assembly protein [Mesorhizobium sp. M1B.F.Ca.ET.045.04.1.1]
MLRVLRNFWNDQRGIALILVAIMLPAIIGMSILAIDMSRANNLHNDLQKGTDAMSLAAAAELDGRSDSITRADRALATLVSNHYKFGGSTGVDQVLQAAGVTRRYLRSLPATDDLPITSANVITDEVAGALEARYIEVRVTPVGFFAMFPVSFLSGNDADNSFNVGAVSVAGFSRGVCDFTPVYICNPYEGSGDSIYSVAADPAKRRRLIELRQQGGSTAQNSPGNYGFLQPPDGSTGANVIRDMIAKTKSAACYNSRGVLLRPGFIATVRDALNVRFDVYNGAMNGNKNDPDYAPGENVRKGYQMLSKGSGSACNADLASPPDPTKYDAFPRDNCFSTGCSIANGRVGDGNWDFNRYWSTNFATTTNPVAISPPLGADGVSPASNTNQPTRYSTYRYEIAQGIVGHPSNGGETGTPACSANKVSDPDRRIIYGAILNCQALAAAGLMGGGASSPPLPVEAFGSFFITETVESGSDQTIRVELVDVTGREGQGTLDNFLRDEVQLYR